jgi:hypothetical protein
MPRLRGASGLFCFDLPELLEHRQETLLIGLKQVDAPGAQEAKAVERNNQRDELGCHL